MYSQVWEPCCKSLFLRVWSSDQQHQDSLKACPPPPPPSSIISRLQLSPDCDQPCALHSRVIDLFRNISEIVTIAFFPFQNIQMAFKENPNRALQLCSLFLHIWLHFFLLVHLIFCTPDTGTHPIRASSLPLPSVYTLFLQRVAWLPSSTKT